jgi:inhibitor of KinA sporulation pathway (predicted exonuclease)
MARRELLNVVDVEATCWAGEPPDGQASEIIEIGLTVVDLDAGERLVKHKIVVRPQRSAVSAFCTELTGLTQAQADSGVSFAHACQILVTEHYSGKRPWASWGDYDRKQFRRQCAHAAFGYPFGEVHVNAKAVFGAALNRGRRPAMASALRIAGLPLEGRHHDGADDAWNIAALILHLNAGGHWPPPG